MIINIKVPHFSTGPIIESHSVTIEIPDNTDEKDMVQAISKALETSGPLERTVMYQYLAWNNGKLEIIKSFAPPESPTE